MMDVCHSPSQMQCPPFLYCLFLSAISVKKEAAIKLTVIFSPPTTHTQHSVYDNKNRAEIMGDL